MMNESTHNNQLNVDTSITSAIELWYTDGLPPGSCTELLLRGRYEEAFKHAHPLIKPHWYDHIEYVETVVPIECRNENYDTWRGVKYERCKVRLDEDIFTL